jgi:S-formylglutathione hydrolase FrmB
MKRLISFISGLLICSLLLSQDVHRLTIKAFVSNDISEEFIPSGRLFIFVSLTPWTQPRLQTWPNISTIMFAKNIKDWNPTKALILNSTEEFMKSSEWTLSELKPGKYYIQLLWDQDQNESDINAPGNIHSDVREIELTKDTELDITLNQVIPEIIIEEDKYVKIVNFKSDTLSSWWKKPVYLKASVLLPYDYYTNPSRKFPVRYNIAGYGGRYTRLETLLARDTLFTDWWFSKTAPQIINIFLDGKGPFGDCYQIDSDNNGPYGFALIREFIPYLENEFKAEGTPESRFLDGCSTGGWVSLALQLFYPDYFNGAFSYSPDPVTFEDFQLINLYEDKNAFYNEWGNIRPAQRDITGDPVITMRDFVYYENVLGVTDSYITSGGQIGAFTALFSPKGENGLPVPIFDPYTGEIDHTVAEYWRRYDLVEYLETNWSELGPKISGKIWIWMGDMDNFYLNPAMRKMVKFLQSTSNPTSDAVITFTPMQGHCWQYSHKNVLMMISEKLHQKKAEAKAKAKEVGR